MENVFINTWNVICTRHYKLYTASVKYTIFLRGRANLKLNSCITAQLLYKGYLSTQTLMHQIDRTDHLSHTTHDHSSTSNRNVNSSCKDRDSNLRLKWEASGLTTTPRWSWVVVCAGIVCIGCYEIQLSRKDAYCWCRIEPAIIGAPAENAITG